MNMQVIEITSYLNQEIFDEVRACLEFEFDYAVVSCVGMDVGPAPLALMFFVPWKDRDNGG